MTLSPLQLHDDQDKEGRDVFFSDPKVPFYRTSFPSCTVSLKGPKSSLFAPFPFFIYELDPRSTLGVLV